MLPSVRTETPELYSPETPSSDATLAEPSFDESAEESVSDTPSSSNADSSPVAHLHDDFDLSALPAVAETSNVTTSNVTTSNVAAPVAETPSQPAFAAPTTSNQESAPQIPSLSEPLGDSFSLKDDNSALPTAAPPQKSVSIEIKSSVAASANEVDAPKPDAPKPDKPRLPTKLPVDFIDLYEVLSLPRDAKFPDLRKRIAELYLDAQKNLDHRNAKKKLQYQQLFEVLLPQARHLLLDPERRVEYDKYLEDYREDQGHRALAAQVLSSDGSGARAQSVEDVVKKARIEEEQLTPEQMAERRATLWKKWEESLATAQDPLAQLKFSMPELQQRAVERKDYMERALIDVTETDRRRQEEAARRRDEERRAREDEEQRAREAQIEERRQLQYNDTISNLTTTGRLYGGFGWGAAILVAGFALLFYLEVTFSLPGRRYPFGSPDTFRLTMLFLILAACGAGAWQGTMRGATRIKNLVRTPEAARQNAEIAAAQIVTERFQRGTSSAQNAPDQHEVERAIREEALQQLRMIRRNSILAMLKRNAVAGWTFALGVGGFIISAGAVFLIDFVSKRGTVSSGRASTVLIGLIIAVAVSLGLAYLGMRIGRKQRVEATAGE